MALAATDVDILVQEREGTMHRDWFMADAANVFVELYADRIEVISPGTLPKGMTVADLGHMTVRRNPLVADSLHRMDFIEKAGTGIRRASAMAPRRSIVQNRCLKPTTSSR